MNGPKICAITVMLACFGCKKQPTEVVFVPSLSGVDQDAVQNFVSDFSVALQESSACTGVKLVLSEPLKDSLAIKEEVKRSEWELFVSVIPEDDTDHGKQLWMVARNGRISAFVESAPKSMAASVCSIVKGRGGTVQSND